MSATASCRAGARLIASFASPTARCHTQFIGRRQVLALLPTSRRLSTTPNRFQEAPATRITPQPTTGPETVPHELSRSTEGEALQSLTDGLSDPPLFLDENEKQVDWTRSYHGLSSTPFTPEQAAILQEEIPYDDIEIKPDGIVYLPEIKYRRILNRAFGPGGWGLAPRGETIVTAKTVTREYGLVCNGRLVSIARGEQQYFDPEGIPTATEGCKSNAMMRCCKDLGVASELWDPRFIKKFVAEMGREMVVEHAVTKKRRKHWMRKDDEVKYPYKEVSVPGMNSSSNNNNNSSPTTGATATSARPSPKSPPATAKPTATPAKK